MTGRGLRDAAVSTGCFIGAIAGATVISLQSRRFLPRTLEVPSDVIGYPTHANFNVDRYFSTYYAVVMVFPILAVILYMALTWSGRRLGLSARRHIGPSTLSVAGDIEALPRSRLFAVQLMRAMVVGAVLGMEAGIAIGRGPRGFLLVILAVMLGYSLVLLMVASLVQRIRGDDEPFVLRFAFLNALAVPLILVGMLSASGASKVVIASTGKVRAYPWLPLWLALLSAFTATSLIAFALSRARERVGIREVERRALLVVAGSTALFLAFAVMLGDLAHFDVFEDGQRIVAARLMTEGGMPWRDFMAAHGLLFDAYSNIIGMHLFGSSVWGAMAGLNMIVYPLYYVSLYLLFVYLFGTSWPFLLTSVLLMFSELGAINNRVAFWPVVLVLLGAMLVKPSVWRVTAFILVIFIGAVIAPEALFALPACGVVIVLYELGHYDRTKKAWENFPRTIRCTIEGLALGAFFIAYLASQHALAPFILYYRIASEVRLSGAIPFGPWLAFTPNRGLAWFDVVAPPAALLVTFWYIVARLRNHKGFDTADWVMGAAALFVFLNYPRFLSRADGHVYLPYALAIPLMLYIIWKIVAAAESWVLDRDLGRKVHQFVTMHPVALVLLIPVAILIAPRSLLIDRLVHIPQQYRATVTREPILSRLGYISTDAVGPAGDPHLYSDRDQVLSAYLQPGDRIFDFANEPGVNFYVLDYNPSTRYYIVNLQMARDAQADLLDGLRVARPKIIVFNDATLGLPLWDGVPNMVRHYDISQFVLDNYRPLAIVHGEMLFADKNLSLPDPTTLKLHLTEPLITKDILFRAQQCDWGYEPNFFAVTPDKTPGGSPVNVFPRAAIGPGFPDPNLAPLRIVLPPGRSWTDFQWMEIDTDSRFRADTMVLYDTDTTTLQRRIIFKTLGNSPRKYLVRVGSCAQWHGYVRRVLLLGHGQPQDISAIRLIP